MSYYTRGSKPKQYLRPPGLRCPTINSTRSDDTIDTIAMTDSNQSELSRLIRNHYRDTARDYVDLFEKLQIKPEFHDTIFAFMKEHRYDGTVRLRLSESYDETSLEDVATNFLEKYGPQIWVSKAPNNKQDPKYREFYFHHKSHQHILQDILEALWARVRNLTFTVDPADYRPHKASKRVRHRSLATKTSNSSVSSIDSAEEQVAMTFIDKVRRDIHGRPVVPALRVPKKRSPKIYIKRETTAEEKG